MKIYGLRIYRSGLFRLFCPLAETWRDCTFANGFCIRLNTDGTAQDPLPSLRARYGEALIDADVNRGLVLLRGDRFPRWGPALHSDEGVLLPVFTGEPSFDLAADLYWNRQFRLNCDTWPAQMRSLLQMWDDVYWQLFTTERSDVDTLVRLHGTDPQLKMCFVDLDREYPDPSNTELQPATTAD